MARLLAARTPLEHAHIATKWHSAMNLLEFSGCLSGRSAGANTHAQWCTSNVRVFLNVSMSKVTTMPNPYSLDLRYRVVWLIPLWALQISQLLNLSERTVRRYITAFQQTGDVAGPLRLLGDFEQLTLLQIVLQNPAIYHKPNSGEC